MTDQDKIAEFLARKGATLVKTAPAYGVDRDFDKVRREEFRAEQQSERHAEMVREAYHAGGRRAVIEALNGGF